MIGRGRCSNNALRTGKRSRCVILFPNISSFQKSFVTLHTEAYTGQLCGTIHQWKVGLSTIFTARTAWLLSGRYNKCHCIPVRGSRSWHRFRESSSTQRLPKRVQTWSAARSCNRKVGKSSGISQKVFLSGQTRFDKNKETKVSAASVSFCMCAMELFVVRARILI